MIRTRIPSIAYIIADGKNELEQAKKVDEKPVKKLRLVDYSDSEDE